MNKFILSSMILLSLTLKAQEKPIDLQSSSTMHPNIHSNNNNASPSGKEDTDALALYNAKQYEDSLNQTEKELKANPKNMDARAIRTWALIALGRYVDAQILAEESLRLAPRDARFVEILGEAYFYQNDLDKALTQFSQYIRMAPRSARIGRVYSLIGDIYAAKGMNTEAEFAYTSATFNLPTSTVLWLKIGKFRLLLKNDQAARQSFERVLQISPNNTQAVQYLKNL